jgi:hypothetical protein
VPADGDVRSVGDSLLVIDGCYVLAKKFPVEEKAVGVLKKG